MLTAPETVSALREARIEYWYEADTDRLMLRARPGSSISTELAACVREYRSLLVWLVQHRLAPNPDQPRYESWLSRWNWFDWQIKLSRYQRTHGAAA
jgi:hypothetical protein